MNDDTHNPTVHVYDDKLQSRLSRLFTISCILSAVLILSLVGYSISAIFTNLINREAEANAENLGRALVANEMDTLIHSQPGETNYFSIDEAKFPIFDQRFQRYLVLFRLSKIKIYSNDRKIVYSTDHTIIGKTDRTNAGLDSALRGEGVSELQKGNEVWDLDDEQRFDLAIVETYLPVHDRKNRVVGAFELYMDFTSYRHEIRKLLTTSLGALFIILVCVFGILIYFMRRATKTIYSKTQELQILSGLLPVCSFCKKIRNDEGEWESLEMYITDRSESEFTHSLCPECKEKHYSEF
jgi:hypothetical protein